MSSDSVGAPIIAGLAVGIALIVLLASFFSSATPIPQRKFPLDLSIDGLKDRYSVGERIDFTIRATGYGTACGHATAQVINIDRNEIVRTIYSGIDVNCDPEPYDFDKTWTLAELGTTSPITIVKVGHYKIIANFGKTAEKYFIVDDAAKRAIDKTRDLSEVKAFLIYYPNANATVYSITTCADRSCETLIRVPSIVEFFQEGDGKLAFLRISVDFQVDNRPISFQVGCGIVGSEDARGIYNSQLEDEVIAEFLQKETRCPE